MLAPKNFSGSQPIVFVSGPGQFTPYLPTIPVSPHWPLTSDPCKIAGSLCNWQRLLLLQTRQQSYCGCIQFTNIHTDTQQCRPTYTKSLHNTWHTWLIALCSALALQGFCLRSEKELLKACLACYFIRSFAQIPFLSGVFSCLWYPGDGHSE